MEISPVEAQESLASIDSMRRRMRREVAGGGAHYFLILWGIIWFLGFLGSYFLAGSTAGYVWLGLDIIGALGSAGIGVAMGRRVRNPDSSTTGGRVGLFWVTLFAFCGLAVLIAWPLGGKQLAMLIIIFAMLGWIAMGFLLSMSLIGLALFVVAIAFGGYFLLRDYFYLCMAILGGGVMIGSGLYIRSRWRES